MGDRRNDSYEGAGEHAMFAQQLRKTGGTIVIRRENVMFIMKVFRDAEFR